MRDTSRGFDGRGHFCTVFITFNKERAMYMTDTQILEFKFMEFFLTK